LESNIEIWKDIPDYEGLYQISNFGQVKSLDKTIVQVSGRNRVSQTRQIKGRILSQFYTAGYPSVKLSKKATQTVYVHRLMASAFIADYSDDLVVNHIDGCRTNNILSNLEICSQSDNIAHARFIGLIPQGSRRPNAKLTESDIPCIRDMLLSKNTHQEIADKYGVNRRVITDIKLGKTWRHVL
jgi:hypothetical protein